MEVSWFLLTNEGFMSISLLYLDPMCNQYIHMKWSFCLTVFHASIMLCDEMETGTEHRHSCENQPIHVVGTLPDYQHIFYILCLHAGGDILYWYLLVSTLFFCLSVNKGPICSQRDWSQEITVLLAKSHTCCNSSQLPHYVWNDSLADCDILLISNDINHSVIIKLTAIMPLL